MRNPVPASASGLRPASAFVVIGVVLVGVGVRVAQLCLRSDGGARASERLERDPSPEYGIVDREGRLLASFVPRLRLAMSPRAFWQAHTPERMADAVAEVIESQVAADELLARMLPDADAEGVVRVQGSLTPEQAWRVQNWVELGGLDASADRAPLEGFWWSPDDEGGFALYWQPTRLLSAAERARHFPGYRRPSPLRWTRRIADELAHCLYGEDALRQEPGVDYAALGRQRERVWERLLPSDYAVVVDEFDADLGLAMRAMFDREGVAAHQMWVDRTRRRVYPREESGLLGHWGHVDRAEGEREALRLLGFADTGDFGDLADEEARAAVIAGLSAPDLRRFRSLYWQRVSLERPRAGLELLCDRTLVALFGDDPLVPSASFAWRPLRLRRGPSSYYVDSRPAGSEPRVVVTLDAGLQREVGRRLDAIVATHRPAVAMAIAVDVATAEVLAVDWRSPFELSGFAPLTHAFTPGSTMKVLTMAIALDTGYLDLDARFDVGRNKEFRLSKGRTIHEAEGALEGSARSPAEILAWSSNAGMAQIGMLVPDALFRERLVELGYGRAPETGLGPAHPGFLPATPWRLNYAHASIGFGHNLMTTLWQHATGLLAVVGGGVARPLRVLRAIDPGQGADGLLDLPVDEGRVVFRRETSLSVRDMMALGAREGTGRHVASFAALPDLDVGSKTGTAEKVPTELCLHVELRDQVRHVSEGSACSARCREALRSEAKPHAGKSCYTSSMCLFGRRSGDEREVLVLVVVDEPTGKARFGSEVAGPTAVAILREALGVTILGEEREPTPEIVADVAAEERRGLSYEPWSESWSDDWRGVRDLEAAR